MKRRIRYLARVGLVLGTLAFVVPPVGATPYATGSYGPLLERCLEEAKKEKDPEAARNRCLWQGKDKTIAKID